MSIDRQKLIEHLESISEELRLKIDGFDEAKGVDSGLVLMWVTKQIVVTHLLNDLYKGTFNEE